VVNNPSFYQIYCNDFTIRPYKRMEVTMEAKKLYRSMKNKMLGGVSAGLGEYLTIDPTLVRLAFVALALMGGPGIVIYLIMWLVVPPEPVDLPPVQ
jgi:phage shock protein C